MGIKRQRQDPGMGGCPLKRLKSRDTSGDGGSPANDLACASPNEHGDYTIAWICALPLELTASRAMFDEEHVPLLHQLGDGNQYVLGRVGQHNVVMACLPGQYRTANATTVATNLKRSFPNVRATLMVGIGGGSPSQADIRLGDIVVGTRVVEYDLGKAVRNGQFEATGDRKVPEQLLRSVVSNLRSEHGKMTSSARVADLLRSRLPEHARPNQPDRLFQSAYAHPADLQSCDGCDSAKLQLRSERPSPEPQIHYGVVASGDRVMKDAVTRDQTVGDLGALCFEMEAAGLMDNLQCLPIRGICDYSDSHKNKDWQHYAAAVAAAYARELLEVLSPSVTGRGIRLTSLRCKTIQPGTAGRSDPQVLLLLTPSIMLTRVPSRWQCSRMPGTARTPAGISQIPTNRRPQNNNPSCACQDLFVGSSIMQIIRIGSTPRNIPKTTAFCGCEAKQVLESRL